MRSRQWIVFDYGGVVSLPQDKGLVAKICSLIGIPVEEFYPLYTKERHHYDAGQFSIHTYWEKNLTHINKDPRTINMDQLTEWDRQSWLSINEDTINYIKEIKSRVRIGLLSNMPYDFFPYIKDTPWLSLFEERVLSFEEKICKPEKKIFQVLLERTKAEPHNVLFIDDLLHNVRAARAMGIHSIQFTDFQGMKREIEEGYRF